MIASALGNVNGQVRFSTNPTLRVSESAETSVFSADVWRERHRAVVSDGLGAVVKTLQYDGSPGWTPILRLGPAPLADPVTVQYVICSPDCT